MAHCFWDTEVSELAASDGGTGLPTARMMESQTFSLSGWARDPNWIHDDGKDYPRLAWEGEPGQAIRNPVIDWLAGQGTAAQPYIISSPDQMTLLGTAPVLWDKTFVLGTDLDLRGVPVFPIGVCPGTDNKGILRDCYWNCGPATVSTWGTKYNGQPLNDGQMRLRASFVGWDFESVWTICEGKGYPRLRWEGAACEP